MKPSIASTGELHVDEPRWAVAGLSLAILLSSLGTSIANVALPTLAASFGVSFQAVQWVVLAYLLAVTIAVVGAGRLGDRIGRRRLLLHGISLFAAASLLCGLAPSFWLLIAARAMQGVGAAAMMALALAMVGETVPKARTGAAMGLLGTMSAVGTALGPSLGGLLIAGFGWRAIFLGALPLAGAAFLLVWRHLPADRRAPAGPGGLDVPGMLLLALTLAAYALAMTLGRGHFGALNLVLLALAAVGLGLFLRQETRAPAPLVRWTLIREPALAGGLAAAALVATVMMATLVVGPFYLARALGLEAGAVGLVLSAGPVVSALVGVPAGRVVDRFGSRRAALIGLSALAVGSCLLVALPTDWGVPGYLAPIGVMTTGYALFQAANNTGVMAGIGPDRRGLVSGLLNLARNLGLVTGASVIGAVFALGVSTLDPIAAAPDAVAAGMRAAFAVATGLVLAALAILAIAQGRRPGA